MKGKIKESRLVYKSEWLEVYEDFISVNKRPEIQQRKKESDNHIKLYNKIKMPQDCATIIPIFSDGSILMIESYRHGVNTVILELPSGGLINNKEQPNEAALKELQEETGYACKTLEAKGWYYVWPSKVNQKNLYFYQTIGKGFRSKVRRYRECKNPYTFERRNNKEIKKQRNTKCRNHSCSLLRVD